MLPKGISKADAKRLLDDFNVRRWSEEQGLTVAPSTATVAEAAKRYLHEIRHQKSCASTEGRWRLHILPKLGKCVVSRVLPTQVEGVLSALRDEGYSQQTRRHVRVTLGAFYEWLLRNGAVATSPVSKVDQIPVPEGKPIALTREQVEALAAATFPGLSDLVHAYFWTSVRPGELLALGAEDVDLAAQELHISKTVGSDTTKTGKERVVVLPDEALPLFTRLVAAAQKAKRSALFLNAAGLPIKGRQANRALQTAAARAGLVEGWEAYCRNYRPTRCTYKEPRKPAPGEKCPRCGFKLDARAIPMKLSLKALRSSSITHAVEKTGDRSAVAANAGHDVKTLERHYLKNRSPHMLAVMNRAFPGKAPTPAPGGPGHERLQRWLVRTGKAPGELAAELGVPESEALAWLAGCAPARLAQLALEQVTGGSVPAASWQAVAPTDSDPPAVH